MLSSWIRTFKMGLVVATAALGLSTSAGAQNLLGTDAGFEASADGTLNSGQWTTTQGSYAGTATSTTGFQTAATGAQFGFIAQGSSTIISATTSTVGALYDVSFDAAAIGDYTFDLIVAGTTVATGQFLADGSSGGSADAPYTHFTFNNIASAGAGFSLFQINSTLTSGFLALDNVVVQKAGTAVPELNAAGLTLPLLLLGGTLLLSYDRRRAAAPQA